MTLALETIASIGRLEELRDEWNSLLRRSRLKHFTLTHEWLCSWWRAFGKCGELRVVAVRRNGELCCVAPLMKSTVRLFGLSLKRLGSFHNFHNPLCDVILADDTRQPIRKLWKDVRDSSRSWDFVEIQPLPILSQSFCELERLVRRSGFRVGIRELAPSPFADTSGTWESYWAGLGSKRRKRWKRCERKAAEEGGVSVLSITSGNDLDHYLAAAFKIEASGWKGRGGTAILQNPQARSLYTSFANLAARNGWFVLDFLTLGDELIAFQYDIVFDGLVYGLKAGYLEKRLPFAPGRLLQKRTMERYFRDRPRRYVFLPPPSPFKLEFGTGSERRFRLRIYNRNVKGFVLFLIDCILIPLFKKLISIAQCRSPAELWRRIVTAFRSNILDNEPYLVFEKDLSRAQPVNARLHALTFSLATEEEILGIASDPDFQFSPAEARRILQLAKKGDVYIVGKLGRRIVCYLSIQFERHQLSKAKMLNLGRQKPFIFICRTIGKYRGVDTYSAALSSGYIYLKSLGFMKCYIDISIRDLPSIQEVKKTGARLIGRYHIVTAFGAKKAVVPPRLLKQISVAPYWLSGQHGESV